MSSESYMIEFILELQVISSKTVKKNSGEKLQNVAISSVNCLVYCLDERELTHKLAKRQDAF